MKNVFVCMLVIALLCCCAFPCMAEEQPRYDTTDIPSDILPQLELQEGETAYLAHRDIYYWDFVNYKDLEELFREQVGREPQYLVAQGEKLVRIYWISKDGKVEEFPYVTYLDEDPLFYELATHEALYLISEDIQIERMYIFEMQLIGIHHVPVVYYETDIGDYVYCLEFGIEYLFPAEEFRGAMKHILDLNPYVLITGGGMGITDSPERDFSRYDIHSENFYLNQTPFPWVYVLAGGAIVLVGALGAVILLKRKKAA